MINTKQKFSLSSEVLNQEIDDETILLDMKSEKYFGLNNVGSHVLEIIKTGADFETLINTLLETFDVDKTQLEKDISELLQELLDADLIQAIP